MNKWRSWKTKLSSYLNIWRLNLNLDLLDQGSAKQVNNLSNGKFTLTDSTSQMWSETQKVCFTRVFFTKSWKTFHWIISAEEQQALRKKNPPFCFCFVFTFGFGELEDLSFRVVVILLIWPPHMLTSMTLSRHRACRAHWPACSSTSLRFRYSTSSL